MKNTKWILCPVCGSKTRNRLRKDTLLKNYPLYCPKYKQENLIDVKELHITVIKESDIPKNNVYEKFNRSSQICYHIPPYHRFCKVQMI